MQYVKGEELKKCLGLGWTKAALNRRRKPKQEKLRLRLETEWIARQVAFNIEKGHEKITYYARKPKLIVYRSRCFQMSENRTFKDEVDLLPYVRYLFVFGLSTFDGRWARETISRCAKQNRNKLLLHTVSQGESPCSSFKLS
jgi:hypothetical protein